MTKQDNHDKGWEKHFYPRIIIRALLAIVFLIIVLFSLARRIDYWQGWLYIATTVIVMTVAVTQFADKKDLAKERMKPGPGTKWWDKIFYAFYIPLFISILVVSSLDSGRFRWSPQFPGYVYFLSYAVYIATNCLVFWAMWVNRFFSSVVRIQSDRGQIVIQDGPYRYVRHPGYIGGIILGFSTALVLGSLWALVPAAANALLIILRTYLEDVTLQRELAGYPEYVQKVHYRLVPGVW